MRWCGALRHAELVAQSSSSPLWLGRVWHPARRDTLMLCFEAAREVGVCRQAPIPASDIETALLTQSLAASAGVKIEFEI